MACVARSKGESWFTRKLERLARGLVRTDIDEAADLPRGTVSVLLSRGTTPQPYSLLKLVHGLRKLDRSAPFQWLADEDDHRLDPPDDGDTSALEDAPLDSILEELQNRYVRAAYQLHHLLLIYEDQKVPVARLALRVLIPHEGGDPEAERVERGLEEIKRLDKLVYEVELLKQFWTLGGITAVGPHHDLGVSPDQLAPEALLSRVETLRTVEPGIRACVEYMTARMREQKWGERGHLRWWLENRAPYHLAAIADDDALADYPQLEDMKESLRLSGYLYSDADLPRELPEFQLPSWGELEGGLPPTADLRSKDTRGQE